MSIHSGQNKMAGILQMYFAEKYFSYSDKEVLGPDSI